MTLAKKVTEVARRIGKAVVYSPPKQPSVGLPEPSSSDWQPPAEFGICSPKNVVRFWLKSLRECGAPVGGYHVHMYVREAEYLIAQYGYVQVLRAVAFMTSPLSKYYQYPFALPKVSEGMQELSNPSNILRVGFVGSPVKEVKAPGSN